MLTNGKKLSHNEKINMKTLGILEKFIQCNLKETANNIKAFIKSKLVSQTQTMPNCIL